ncbi:MAG: divalent-cation tolerance protein CutA [Nitrospinae bacterium]|nr:divalent-cation tolerance protein CutA [Nitrospinota bacterium]
MEEFIEIHVTTSTIEEAREIGAGLVDTGLVSCSQITTSIESTYRWEEDICREEEYLLTLKTKRKLFGEVADYIRERHSYEVPQIVAVPIVAGTDDYLGWIRDNTKD